MITSHLTGQIPVIAVFTKFDLLVSQHIRQARKHNNSEPATQKTPQRNAEEDFERSIKGFLSTEKVPYVGISTKTSLSPLLSLTFKVQGVILTHLDYLHTLRKLTEVTRQSLHDVEGDLWLPWAAAQQINARQKVEQSIRYGLTRNWRILQLIGSIFSQRGL